MVFPSELDKSHIGYERLRRSKHSLSTIFKECLRARRKAEKEETHFLFIDGPKSRDSVSVEVVVKSSTMTSPPRVVVHHAKSPTMKIQPGFL